MKKMMLALITLCAVPAAVSFAQSEKMIKDLTTGVVDGTTTPIAYGQNDDTWRVIWPAGSGGGIGYKPAKVCTNLGGVWAAADCGRWITHLLESGTNDPTVGGVTGVYGYQAHFTINFSCLSWVKVNFTKLGADNRARNFRINGHPYTIGPLSWVTTNWFNPLKTNISINIDLAHLVAGDNVIDIDVSNDDAYEGLFICGNITQNYCP